MLPGVVLLCVWISALATVLNAEDRYLLVPRPSDSVIPARFYQPSLNVNLLPLPTIAEPSLESVDFPLYMLIVTRSSPHHFQRRDAIRLTWGADSYTVQHNVKVIFIVGRSADPTVHTLLQQESMQHNDILYVDFMDSYANLTIKDIAAFQYVRKFKDRCQYTAIAGDEIVLDVTGVVAYLRNSAANVKGIQRKVSVCYEFPCCMPVIRDNSSKYLVQGGRYEGTLYPPYCSGTFFVVQTSLVTEIYYMMLDTPSFMPDDAWLGIVYQKLALHLDSTYTHFAGISSYKRELRLLKFAQTSKFYDDGIFAIILDYAFKTEDVHSKIIELWSLISAQKRLRASQRSVWQWHYYLIWSLALLLALCVCSSSRKCLCSRVYSVVSRINY